VIVKELVRTYRVDEKERVSDAWLTSLGRLGGRIRIHRHLQPGVEFDGGVYGFVKIGAVFCG
jgi:hypothetical protein